MVCSRFEVVFVLHVISAFTTASEPRQNTHGTPGTRSTLSGRL
jgi:hypothetical protein